MLRTANPTPCTELDAIISSPSPVRKWHPHCGLIVNEWVAVMRGAAASHGSCKIRTPQTRFKQRKVGSHPTIIVHVHFLNPAARITR